VAGVVREAIGGALAVRRHAPDVPPTPFCQVTKASHLAVGRQRRREGEAAFGHRRRQLQRLARSP
jgi:hypothetical protein